MLPSALGGAVESGLWLKWAAIALAVVLACAGAVLQTSFATAQQQDTFVSPTEGGAGARFQIVGETGWTPGETVTISFGFADEVPGETFAGPFYNEQSVTVLRDGTWSFPVVINNELFPFPLWRPGFIVVQATGASQITITPFTYTVLGASPEGQPPLAELGFGPGDAGPPTNVVVGAAFVAALGVLLVVSGEARRRGLR